MSDQAFYIDDRVSHPPTRRKGTVFNVAKDGRTVTVLWDNDPGFVSVIRADDVALLEAP